MLKTIYAATFSPDESLQTKELKLKRLKESGTQTSATNLSVSKKLYMDNGEVTS